MRGYVEIKEGCVESQKKARPLVSVIVPIFNTERYLDQALNSIENQTLLDLEIICVNDGSTDGSLAIIQEHARYDERIRLIDKPNGGYGSACNRGLEEATGKWITIMEPDDWIESGMYKDMLTFAARFKVVPDVIKTPYWRILESDTPREIRINCSYRGRIRPARQPFVVAEQTHLLTHHPSIWSALYRASFLKQNNIRFHEIPGAGWADNPFLIETLCTAQNIVYLDTPYYCYREETPEKAADFARRNALLPLERWNDMTDLLEAYNITDKRIWLAQISRGFTYLGGILEETDLGHDTIRTAAVEMFKRMDPELVQAIPNVSPAAKRLYYDLLELPQPPLKKSLYLKSLIKEGFYTLANAGAPYAAHSVKKLLKSYKKRAGEK